jgi:hypothetical protein
MTIFSAMLSALGMTLDDAAALLGCSRDAVASMSNGRRSVTRQDLKRFRMIYAEMSAGRIGGFHAGAEAAAKALWVLRGTDELPGVVDARSNRRGQKLKRKTPEPA